LKSQLGAADIITPYNISGNTMSTAILYPGPDLPFPMSGHCMVNINSSMIMIIVGYYSTTDYLKQTFFMDIESETFIQGPIQNYGRKKPQCSLIQNTVGPPAILVTGQRRMAPDTPDFGEILYLNNSNNWLAGPNTSIFGNSRKDSGNGFLMQGDQEVIFISDPTDSFLLLYKLRCADCQWESIGSYYLQSFFQGITRAVMIPDNIFECFILH
jgi:hypothetical protein